MSNIVSIHGYELHVHDGEPMVKDLDLAVRLEYKEPRAIKKLIKRLIDSGAIKASEVRDTVSRAKNNQMVVTFYLSEKAALKVITKSETEKADQITDEMIDVFISYRNGTLQPQLPSKKELAQWFLESEQKNEALTLENQEQAQKISKLENFFTSGMTISAFGKMLNGVNCQKMNSYCFEELNWLYNESRSGKNKRWRVRGNARDKYLTETPTEISSHGSDPFTKHDPKLLQEGARKLYELYLDNQLPMKKTWDGEHTHFKFTEGEAA
jgi:hypothetical protein